MSEWSDLGFSRLHILLSHLSPNEFFLFPSVFPESYTVVIVICSESGHQGYQAPTLTVAAPESYDESTSGLSAKGSASAPVEVAEWEADSVLILAV